MPVGVVADAELRPFVRLLASRSDVPRCLPRRRTAVLLEHVCVVKDHPGSLASLVQKSATRRRRGDACRSDRLSQGPNGCRHSFRRTRAAQQQQRRRLRILIIWRAVPSAVRPSTPRCGGGGRVKSQIDQIAKGMRMG